MEDPRRRMFAPAPGQVSPGAQIDIVAWHCLLSDDGQAAAELGAEVAAGTLKPGDIGNAIRRTLCNP